MAWHRPNSAAGRITSPFGPRGPIAGAPNASRLHLGVDLRAGTLTVPSAIYAAAAGTVRRIYRTPLGAWVLELDHGDKVWTRYVHMQRAGIFVDVGDRVIGGQHVAAASNSGAPTVHLHFEVLIRGAQVDPVPWLKARGVDLTVTTTTASSGSTTGLKPAPPITIPPIPQEEDDMFTDADRQLMNRIAVFAETAMKAADIATNAANRAAEYADIAGKKVDATRGDVGTVANEVRHVARALGHPIPGV